MFAQLVFLDSILSLFLLGLLKECFLLTFGIVLLLLFAFLLLVLLELKAFLLQLISEGLVSFVLLGFLLALFGCLHHYELC